MKAAIQLLNHSLLKHSSTQSLSYSRKAWETASGSNSLQVIPANTESKACDVFGPARVESQAKSTRLKGGTDFRIRPAKASMQEISHRDDACQMIHGL